MNKVSPEEISKNWDEMVNDLDDWLKMQINSYWQVRVLSEREKDTCWEEWIMPKKAIYVVIVSLFVFCQGTKAQVQTIFSSLSSPPISKKQQFPMVFSWKRKLKKPIWQFFSPMGSGTPKNINTLIYYRYLCKLVYF